MTLSVSRYINPVLEAHVFVLSLKKKSSFDQLGRFQQRPATTLATFISSLLILSFPFFPFISLCKTTTHAYSYLSSLLICLVAFVRRRRRRSYGHRRRCARTYDRSYIYRYTTVYDTSGVNWRRTLQRSMSSLLNPMEQTVRCIGSSALESLGIGTPIHRAAKPIAFFGYCNFPFFFLKKYSKTDALTHAYTAHSSSINKRAHTPIRKLDILNKQARAHL